MHIKWQSETLKKKKPFRRPRDTCEDNIKMDIKNLRCELFSTGLRQDPVAGPYDDDN
jgi:hypothetical protein